MSFRFITQCSRLALTPKTVMVNSNRDCIMDLNQNLIELRCLVRGYISDILVCMIYRTGKQPTRNLDVF